MKKMEATKKKIDHQKKIVYQQTKIAKVFTSQYGKTSRRMEIEETHRQRS